MMYVVCAHYCGTTIAIVEFEYEDEAEDFIKNPVVDGEEYYYPDEMWIEEKRIREGEQLSEIVVHACDYDPDECPF